MCFIRLCALIALGTTLCVPLSAGDAGQSELRSMLVATHTIPGSGGDDPKYLTPVLRFDLVGTAPVTELSPIRPAPESLVTDPVDVAFNSDGELFVANRHGNVGEEVGSIARFKFDGNGNPIPNGSITGNSLEAVHGLAFSPAGELFAANRLNSTISRFLFDAEGNAIPNGTLASLSDTVGLAFSEEGELFVTHASGPIRRFLFNPTTQAAIPNGTISIPASQALRFLAFSSSGELFVPDITANRVFRILLSPSGSASANGSIEVPGSPIGVAFSALGELFVSLHDSGGISRFLFDPSGNTVPNGSIDTPQLGGLAVMQLPTSVSGGCSVSFAPAEASFGAAGGAGETVFTLMEAPATAPSSCPGSMDMVASDVPWITINDIDLTGGLIGMTGRMVKGPVKFTVAPLDEKAVRQGTISARVGLTSGGNIQTSFVVTQGDSHQVTGVLDAASGQPVISPGSIVSVFGEFAKGTALATAIPLPVDLEGFSVTFDGEPGALFGVFAGEAFDQANAQVPWNVDVSDNSVEVKVHWQDSEGEIWSEPLEVDGALASPGIYMFPPGTTQAIVTNFKQAGDDVIAGSWAQAPGSIDPVVGQPAAIGGVVTIWCNGLGPVSPLPQTGDVPQPAGTVPFADKTVRVFVGGVEAPVLGSVLQPTSVGLNQINIIVPNGVTPGDTVPIVVEVECPDGTKLRSREDVTIAVRAAP